MMIGVMMGGRASRRKGSRVERQIVHLHRDMGLKAKRVPLSGAADGFKGDVLIDLGDYTLQSEIKARKSGTGFTVLDRWLGDNDLLFVKRDRRKPAVYMPWETYESLMSRISIEVMETENE